MSPPHLQGGERSERRRGGGGVRGEGKVEMSEGKRRRKGGEK